MSLTDFVANPEVREKIDDNFPNEGQRASNPLKTECQTDNYSTIGTAFDYLLRFWLRREVPEVYTKDWVANAGLSAATLIPEADIHEYEQVVKTAEKRVDEFLERGELTNSLIESAIDLARIDVIYRAKILPDNLGKYEQDDIDDLRMLITLAADSGVFSGEEAYLNPIFGFSSRLVGGADCDVILDGTLIDIKATKHETFKVSYWRQLVGYLVLADIHQSLHDQGVYEELSESAEDEFRELQEIEEFGVYYARHGEFSSVSSNAVYNSEEYTLFKKWFVRTALDMNAVPDKPRTTIREEIL